MSSGKIISKSHCHRYGLCVTKVWHRSICTPSDNILLNTPVRRRESHVRSIAWRLRPLARISLRQLRGTYRIVRISNHLFNIASPVIGDLVVKCGAFSTHRRAGMRSVRGRQRTSPSLSLRALIYSFTRVSCKNAEYDSRIRRIKLHNLITILKHRRFNSRVSIRDQSRVYSADCEKRNDYSRETWSH